jgi:DNA-binding transcriptional LysR family regulator
MNFWRPSGVDELTRERSGEGDDSHFGRRDSLPRNWLKLSHLRMIVALEEHEMVGAAAIAVNISQPAASRMIAEMEALLGAPLCERLARGVRLTPLGHSLARHARSVLLQLVEAEREISDVRDGRAGSAALGAVTGPAIDLGAPAIAKLRAIYPRIELSIKIDASNVLARDLLASRLDFIIARVPDDLNPRLFDCHTIGVEEACLVVRRGHPLVGRGPVSVKELGAYEWVIQPRGTPLRRTIEGMFLAANVPLPDRLSNTTSLLLTMIMVAKSDAIAPMSIEAAKFVAEGTGDGPIEILPTKRPIVIQPYSLITVRGRPMSPAARSVYDFIRDEAMAGDKTSGEPRHGVRA